MTTDDELLRQVTTYLDECEGTTLLPDSIREAVMADFPKTPQSRPTGLARYSMMTTQLKFGMAAAIVAVAVLLGFTYLNGQNVGPSPDATATPSTSASTTAQLGIPAELQFDFLGPAKDIAGDAPGDRGDLEMTRGILRFMDGDTAAFYSVVGLTADGKLQLVSAADDVCAEGDVGTYTYALSTGGTILTVEEGTDDCAARAAAMPGEYLRDNCRNPDDSCLGTLEAGTYVSHWFEPRPSGEWQVRHGAFSYTVPDGWAAYSDGPHGYGLTPSDEYETSPVGECYDCPGIHDAVTVLASPGAATEDCGEEGTVPGVGFGAQDLADWLVAHSGLVASEPESRTVGGHSAISLTIEGSSEWTGTCDTENPFVAVPIFFHPDGGYHWALNVGDRYHVTLIDLGSGNTVAVVVDAADEAEFDAFVADAMPIIDSFEFPDR